MEDSKESVYSWEYVEETPEYLIEFPEEDYPLIYMNNSKEPEVSKDLND